VGFHERGDRRQHGLGLGGVALERIDHQREPGGVGEQPDHNLRVQAAFLTEPRLTEPITSISLEIESGHVVEHQAGRAQPGMRGAGRGQRAPPRLGREHRQPPLHRRIRRGSDARLGQHPQRIELAGRLDDPRQHQRLEHLITVGRRIEPEHLIPAGQRVPQVPHPRRRDRQRATTISTGVQAQIELALTCGQALPRRRLKKLQLLLAVRRADVLDIPRTPPRRMHNLHRRRARGRLHGAHIRHQHSLDRST